jgi:hypothetical protein
MTSAHQKWIDENVTGNGYGKCAEASEAMLAAFPELKRVRGHYYCMIWGERAHWWLVATDGSIVDPTSAQFPTKGNGVYVELAPDAKEPKGMCPNCGELFYESDGGGCCSPRCHAEYRAYCMSV